MARTYWLDLFTGTTWDEFLAAGGQVSGFRQSRWKNVNRMAVGDWLLCYVTGISRWIGILEVTGEPFLGEDKIWGEDVFPARVRVKVVAQLLPEHAVPAILLRDKMSYFRPEAPVGWTGHFRGSPVHEKPEDGELIADTILEAVKNPTDRPYSAAKWQRQLKGIESSEDEVVSVPEPDELVVETTPSPVSHEEIQHLLLKLGHEMGFDLWLASNDRGHKYDGQVLGEMPGIRDSIPAQFTAATNKTIELIDVLWLDENSIAAAFEVEHTTLIYSGLLRMADLLAMQPNLNIRLYIVAPDERRSKVLKEISRPVFTRMKTPLRDRCQLIPYSELKGVEERFHGVMHLLKPDILDEIAESAD